MQPVRARLIPFAPRNGFENMATDEYLVTWHERTGVPALRIYGWSPPAISLGRYQGVDCLNLEACRADGVDIVRRITGGGAIFHDSEVTYSLTCTIDHLDEKPHTVMESYEILNRFIIDMYLRMGVSAAYAKDCSVRELAGHRTPFCFSGNEKYDILIEGKKIGGNAQRRKGKVVFQHGSIPLAVDRERIRRYFRSPVLMNNFTSLDEITGSVTSPAAAGRILAESFADTAAMELYVEDIGPAERAEIDAIIKRKYLCSGWNMEGRAEKDEDPQAGMA